MTVFENGYFFEIPDKWLSEHDKQIRNEVIDECIEALGNNIWNIAKLEQMKGAKE